MEQQPLQVEFRETRSVPPDVPLDLRRIGTKRNGARNPEWGSGENAKFAREKHGMPTDSWWAVATDAEFVTAYLAQLARLRNGRDHVNYSPKFSTLDVW